MNKILLIISSLTRSGKRGICFSVIGTSPSGSFYWIMFTQISILYMKCVTEQLKTKITWTNRKNSTNWDRLNHLVIEIRDKLITAGQMVSMLACPYEIFKCTKCVKFLFVLVLLDFRKRTKKRFRKSVSNFLRYEFFLYLIFGRFVEIIRISMYFSQMTKFGHNQYFRKAI